MSLCVAWSCTPTQVRYAPRPPEPPGIDGVEAILYLVGDAGEANEEREEVLAHLSAQLESVAGDGEGPPVVVAFLGDNIYDAGLPRRPSDEDVAKLSGQVLALGNHPGVQGVFLPGNHDWANGASLGDGRAAIARQNDWVERVSPGRGVRFLPDDGCPGPATEDVGETVHLVFIDTEWLLRRPERRCGTADEFFAQLTADLRANADKRVVIMSHHPQVSGGPHGGNVAPLEQGPFVYYLARRSGTSIQDIQSGAYASAVRGLQAAVAASETRPLAHAAGHDHTLQVIGMSGPGTPAYQLVSGAASKSERSRRIEGTRFATDGYGYMRLDFDAGQVRLTVFARGVDSGPVRAVFSCRLSTDGTNRECPEAPLAAERP
jgi:hypothetical protein